jgi:hypothetical protein
MAVFRVAKAFRDCSKEHFAMLIFGMISRADAGWLSDRIACLGLDANKCDAEWVNVVSNELFKERRCHWLRSFIEPGLRVTNVFHRRRLNANELFKRADYLELRLADPSNADDPNWLRCRMNCIRQLGLRRENSRQRKIEERGKRRYFREDPEVFARAARAILGCCFSAWSKNDQPKNTDAKKSTPQFRSVNPALLWGSVPVATIRPAFANASAQIVFDLPSASRRFERQGKNASTGNFSADSPRQAVGFCAVPR